MHHAVSYTRSHGPAGNGSSGADDLRRKKSGERARRATDLPIASGCRISNASTGFGCLELCGCSGCRVAIVAGIDHASRVDAVSAVEVESEAILPQFAKSCGTLEF